MTRFRPAPNTGAVKKCVFPCYRGNIDIVYNQRTDTSKCIVKISTRFGVSYAGGNKRFLHFPHDPTIYDIIRGGPGYKFLNRDLKIVVYGKRLTSETLLAIKTKSSTVR